MYYSTFEPQSTKVKVIHLHRRIQGWVFLCQAGMGHQVELLPRKESHDDPEKRKLDRTNGFSLYEQPKVYHQMPCVREGVYSIKTQRAYVFSN